MSSEILFSPAKINLFLVVTGRRSDGFHNLISLAAPIGFGDEIELEQTAENGIFLTCDRRDLPTDENNLVVRAIRLFQAKTGNCDGWRIRLRKRIPIGGGLGGGSSNAANVLLAVNRILGHPLPDEELHRLAAEIGSDCPFFLMENPSIMRGRGENTDSLEESIYKRIRGRRIALFWPSFSISTPWVYGMFGKGDGSFSSSSRAEQDLSEWLEGNQPVEALLANDFENILSSKFPTFPILFNDLQKSYGVDCSISGTGSACFAFLDDESLANDLKSKVYSAWGEEAGFECVSLL